MSKKRSIALTTWFTYHNYGSALQVSALYSTLVRLGYNVDVIDYEPKGKYVARPKLEGSSRALSELALKGVNKLVKRNYTFDGRERLFEQYLCEALTLTTPCPTMAELEGLNDRYDTFVCGSDQIWAPSVFDPHYFLDFVGDDRLKVAYAPSVGLPRVDDLDVARQMARLCDRMDALSTREELGSRIVSKLTGREVTTVVDPTLLIPKGEWESHAVDSNIAGDRPYLLAYMLGRDEAQWRRVYALAKGLGLPVRIIPVFQTDHRRNGCIEDPIGPREFVSLLACASYVCTDSFHGVAFSVNLGREFCAFERFRKDDALNQNSRVYNLLDKIGLRDRLAIGGIDDERLLESIDWDKPQKRLSAERGASLSWLQDALQMEPRESYFDAKDNISHNRSLCCGCTSCDVVCPVGAIEMSLDGEGFYRAHVNEDVCISCGKCRRACPFVEHSSSRPITAGSLFSYKCSDAGQLLESSSGGAGAEIAKATSVAGAAVLGCAFDVQKGGAASKLVAPGDAEGLASLAGSKYMQSEVGDALAEAAAHEGPLLVTGTPCQVAAARNLLGRRDDVTYVDFICHGVPSRNLYTRYREWLRERYSIDSEGARTVFRYKPRGWRERYIYSTDGEHEACLHQRRDPYFLMFEATQCYAGCCYECPWRMTSAADVRLGDYWGPRFEGDRTGVSMVLALTERGYEVMRGLSKAGAVADAPMDDYLRYQQTANNPEPVFRDEVLSKLADPSIGIRAVCDEFAEPVAKRRDLMRKLDPLKALAKRLLGRR